MKVVLRVACAIVVGGCASGTSGPGVPTPARPAPEARLIPAPESIERTNGAPFTIARTTTIVVDAGNQEVLAIGEALGQLLRPATGYALPVTPMSATGAIVLRLGGDPSLGDEGYAMTVSADSVRLVANRPAGLFRGIQTVRQLLPPTVESQI
ncbi:MAG TPA: glycoside hydrolase family 20 zincin-like fold domain-containing protein, partial [Gemmatimonadaceae bacterium]|nr:glycoside hydrolase family 20 zincin-like fold domain-containing protein [Gemmatimonadaceae bacterium]